MKLSKIFQNRKAQPLFIENRYAVVLLLVREGGEDFLIFEKRAPHLRNQPGEISFPGGSIEAGESPKETGIRETMEELNVKKEQIKILGEMDYLIRRDGSAIRAFVGRLEGLGLKDIRPSKDEVDFVFAVPLKFFLENPPRIYTLSIEIREEAGFPYEDIPGGKNYPWSKDREKIYFYYWEDQIIWGLTAKLTYAFVEILKENKDN